ILPVLALALLASSTAADFITGKVLAPNGAPMPGVNIDAIRVSNGNNINLSNDGTDAAGNFTTTIPADVYDLWFYPPAPPTTSHVTYVLRNVVVTGTKNLGTLQLQAGIFLSGHLQTTGGAPIAGIDLRVTDNVTGFEVPVLGKTTNAFGNFQIAVPKNSISVFIDGASAQPTFVLVSQTLTLAPTVDTNLGNITMQPGYIVSGHVQRTSNALPVANVDLDFKNLATGDSLLLTNDNTNATGNFSVIVGAGTYNIDFAAPVALRLAGKRVPALAVSANTVVPTVSLDNGALLSGIIKSFDNIVQVNADVDVYRQATGELVPSFADNTSGTGAYSVVVPLDNLEIAFHPPTYTVPLGSDVHSNFLVTADTTLNGFLPACPAPNNYGAGMVGTGGFVPHLSATGGTNRVGNPTFGVQISNGRGAATTILVISGQSRSVPFLGGTLLVNTSPAFCVKIPTVLGGASGVGGAGSKFVPASLPATLANLDVYCQAAVRDISAIRGWALSDGLHFKVCP
ncbi:MAG: hypothetical protein ABL998_14260, partial [Planctomycetota bacterium]